jgi:hypothetical protein
MVTYNAYLTLADWASRVDPQGNADDIAEILSQCNEIFDDMIWKEGNLPTGHKYTVRTALPKGMWRMLNQGVPFTKSATAQVSVGCGMLEDYSRVDRKLAELNGNLAKFRMDEDNGHLEGLSQQMAQTIFYGNATINPQQFTGIAPLYNTITMATAQNAQNVFDGGGRANANTSMYLLGWGERTVYGVFPKASKAGLLFEDKGDVRPAFDSNGYEYEAYTSYFRWEAGLAVEDWRYTVRVANLDTTAAAGGLASATPPDIFAMLSKAVVRLPTMGRRESGITKTDAPGEVAPGIRPAIYVNRTVRQYMDLQAIRDKNVLLTPKEYAGGPVVEFRGVPIRVCDAILNTEATLS